MAPFDLGAAPSEGRGGLADAQLYLSESQMCLTACLAFVSVCVSSLFQGAVRRKDQQWHSLQAPAPLQQW